MLHEGMQGTQLAMLLHQRVVRHYQLLHTVCGFADMRILLECIAPRRMLL